MSSMPFVSVIVPCRNEEKFIGMCVNSIVENGYPQDRLEVLVVDGLSEDATQTILAECIHRYPCIRVLKNEKRITSAARNVGVQHARGNLIMIVDAHATLEKDAISQCVRYSREYGADNVGGILKVHPRNDGLMAEAIVRSISNPFGVGNSNFRIISQTNMEPRWADTAAYGCYRREVFEKIGVFNERCLSEDSEFNQRMMRAGGKTLLVPSVVVNYYARSDYPSFCRHNFRNGAWAILTFEHTDVMPVRWRHLVPLAFVSSVAGSALLGLVTPPFFWPLLAIVGAYGMSNLAASIHVAWRERNLQYLAVMPFVFASLHIAYGLGSLWGVFEVARAKQFWSRLLRLQWFRRGQ